LGLGNLLLIFWFPLVAVLGQGYKGTKKFNHLVILATLAKQNQGMALEVPDNH
jgi:hypothetical protein